MNKKPINYNKYQELFIRIDLNQKRRKNMWATILTKIPLVLPLLIKSGVWLGKKATRMLVRRLVSPGVLMIFNVSKVGEKKELVINVNLDAVKREANATPVKYDNYLADFLYAAGEELWKIKGK